jgi:hypothetical protein
VTGTRRRGVKPRCRESGGTKDRERGCCGRLRGVVNMAVSQRHSFPTESMGCWRESSHRGGGNCVYAPDPHRLLGCSTGLWRRGILPPVGRKRGDMFITSGLPCGSGLVVCLNLLVDARDWTCGTSLTAPCCPHAHPRHRSRGAGFPDAM